MKNDDFERIAPVIDMAQRLHGSLHDKLIEKGVAPIDALIASLYATHQLAAKLHGNPVAAVEWMRDALDTIERQALGTKH
ncbi:hypothetical protein [Stakelama marina]|uniref:Uncharacterized protein n=1 Tax=Stakelama marina TaxID=2826939 RepID=A0A8T4IB14_9SPHN|nr:hypothetical protein [Stakelama marina]MBR0551740.1 hypothetical protein [Stakelama marina]